MKRIVAFAACHLYASAQPYRWLTLVGVLLITAASVRSADAQSRDRENPTRLTSTEISGVIGDNLGDSYYYSFVAGPGEVTLTLNLEGKGAPQRINFYGMGLELFNENGQRISSRDVRAYSSNERAVERINFSRRQRVLLHIKISERSDSAKYRLRLSGPINVGEDTPTGIPDAGGVQDSPNTGIPEAKETCLPKQGTLIVKMKDGSKKIIDLSEAETVTIVP